MSKEIYVKRINKRKLRNLWLKRLFIWLFIALTLVPIFFVVTASLAKGTGFFQATLIPASVTFDNYVSVLKNTDFLIWLKNSLIISSIVAVLQLIMTTTAAYAFSRMKFKFRKNGLMMLLILQMFPSMMTLPAIIGLAYKLGFMDNLAALILLLVGGSAFNIWLLKGYIDGLPRELDEAAMVDGAGPFKIFWSMIIPLSRPMLIVIFLFTFIGTYSEFPLSSALLKDTSNYTLALGLQSFIRDKFSANWTQYSAAAVMASLPIVIIFMSFQKFLAKGLTAGSVKG
ncbi:sugar ABC transporter permease [Clostridium hydrogenum]|uniref:sugar ABC transporter permease n=1 Tax=Clostridium hydrogenum TaxID=2855764 RepID=UPI001F1F1DC3|nr:sugar ABC transporter permease [Clostridium hydrogenum]